MSLIREHVTGSTGNYRNLEEGGRRAWLLSRRARRASKGVLPSTTIVATVRMEFVPSGGWRAPCSFKDGYDKAQ